MNERLNKPKANETIQSAGDGAFDFDALLHPGQAFSHPSNVVNDPDLTLNEKRAILASWASDACAVEAAPALRKTSGGPIVHFDEIMDALRMLDRQQAATADAGRYRKSTRWRRITGRSGGGRDNQGSPLY